MKAEINLAIVHNESRSPSKIGNNPATIHYPYLFEEAGKFSRPSDIECNPKTMNSSKNYDIGDELFKDLEKASQNLPIDKDIRHIHSQYTVIDRFLSSRCLGIHHTLKLESDTLCVDQCGTVGLGRSLQLVNSCYKNDKAVLLTCADQWLEPYQRNISDTVGYCDSYGYLLLNRSELDQKRYPVIRRVHRFSHSDMSEPEGYHKLFNDFGCWLSNLLKYECQDVQVIIGDPYQSDYLGKIYDKFDKESEVIPPRKGHEGTVATLASIQEFISLKSDKRKSLIWSLSLSGEGYAFVIEKPKEI
ncbi:MAG: hypothetical protein HRU19_07165 [Pseudobacteriovorax sp.]|nr:hypothetical protein [Pseudobacteriovorax sp.]